MTYSLNLIGTTAYGLTATETFEIIVTNLCSTAQYTINSPTSDQTIKVFGPS